MNKAILDQLNVDITKLLYDGREKCTRPTTFKASLKNKCAGTRDKTAILQVNIAESGTCEKQLAAALDLLSKEFAAVTIFIDMKLALLVYSILLPYMTEEQLQNIVLRSKLDWIDKNMPIIRQTKLPCTITSDEDFIQHDSKPHHKLEEEAKILKEYLFEAHRITNAIYQQKQHSNDKAIELYLISRLEYLRLNDNKKSVHVTLYDMLGHTQHLTLILTKTVSCKKHLPTSTELNKNLHSMDFLGKISERKSYLQHSINNFPGHVYLQATNHKTIACNKQQSMAVGISDESFITGKTPAEFYPKEDAERITDLAKEVTSTNETKILVEDYPLLGERTAFLSIKTPLRNKKNKVVGIIGFSQQIKDEEENTKLENVMLDVMEKGASPDKSSDNVNNSLTSNIKKTIEQMPGHVFWQGLDGSIHGCNYNHTLCFGGDDPKHMVGKTAEYFLVCKDVLRAEKDIQEIITTGKPVVRKETYKTIGGPLEMISHKTPIRDNDNNVIGVMVVAIDVSANKQREITIAKEKKELALATKRKNHFISTMENDMLKSFNELHNMTISYAMGEKDETKRQQMYEIANCAKDLIRFSKNIGAADYKDLISVKDLVKDIIAENSASLRERRLDIDIDYDDSIPDTILASEYKLKGTLGGLIMGEILNTQQQHFTIVIKLESCSANEIAISFSLRRPTGENKQLYVFKQYTKDDKRMTAISYAIPETL